jgi:hypothetical protein
LSGFWTTDYAIYFFLTHKHNLIFIIIIFHNLLFDDLKTCCCPNVTHIEQAFCCVDSKITQYSEHNILLIGLEIGWNRYKAADNYQIVYFPLMQHLLTLTLTLKFTSNLRLFFSRLVKNCDRITRNSWLQPILLGKFVHLMRINWKQS